MIGYGSLERRENAEWVPLLLSRVDDNRGMVDLSLLSTISAEDVGCAACKAPTPSYTTGLTFIFMVCVIWAAASMIVQYTYADDSFDSPFLLTYVGVSLFTLLLPLTIIAECIYPTPPAPPPPPSKGSTHDTPLDEDLRASPETVETSDSYTLAPLVRQRWTHQQHMKVAIQIAPVWFLTNMSYNSALRFTSIASSTTIASTCSVFAFAMEMAFSNEKFDVLKLTGVLLAILGTIFTGIHDSQLNDPGNNCVHHCEYAILGDVLAVATAIGFAVYSVQVKVLCPRDEETYRMQLILGYMGLFSMLILSPVATWKLTTQVKMPLTVFGLSVVRGLFDYVLSEYLFLRAVVLTTATVTNVGLGLTVPLGFFADFLMGKSNIISFYSLSGALCILVGFVVVNVSSSCLAEGKPYVYTVQAKTMDKQADYVRSTASFELL